MNKDRRARILFVCNKCDEAIWTLHAVKDDEVDAYENLPDNFRYGDRGEEMQNYIEMLETAIGYIEDAESVLEQI